ncbi:MAG: RNA polymerase sigma factor [Alphaproteobacteria bacterium]
MSSQPKTFEEQVAALHNRIYRFALNLTLGNQDKAQDIAQEVMARAFLNKDKFTEGTRLDSWLFKIAQNFWLDQLRKKSHEAEDPKGIYASNATSPDHSDSMTEQREIAESYDAITNQEQKEVFRLVLLEGLSYADVVEKLGIPLGTVMSRLNRARKAFKEHYERSTQGSTALTPSQAAPASSKKPHTPKTKTRPKDPKPDL